MSRIPTTIITRPDGSRVNSQSRGVAVVSEQTGDRQTNDLQANAQRATQAMRSHPHGDGLTVVKDVSFVGGAGTVIAHGLGRPYRGYSVVRVRTGYSDFRELANSDPSLDARQILIQAENDCLADVWVW